MIIQTKLEMGQTVIIEVDSGMQKGKITGIYVKILSGEQTITYLVHSKENIEIPTKEGLKKILDERDSFVSEEKIIEALQRYKKEKQSGASDEAALWNIGLNKRETGNVKRIKV